MVERRSAHRFRSLLGARISFGGKRSTMDCVVRNISAAGALIVFPNAALTPTEFRLHVMQRGETHAARVVWRGHDRAGLALSDTVKVAVPADMDSRLRRLEAQSRRMRRQLEPII